MIEAYLVHHFVERSATRDPESVFVVEGGTGARATYGEIADRAHRFARLLHDEGIGRGDRVGLLAKNSRLYVEAYYGILAAGAHGAKCAACCRRKSGQLPGLAVVFV